MASTTRVGRASSPHAGPLRPRCATLPRGASVPCPSAAAEPDGRGAPSDWQGTAAPAHPGRAPPAPGCGAPAQFSRSVCTPPAVGPGRGCGDQRVCHRRTECLVRRDRPAPHIGPAEPTAPVRKALHLPEQCPVHKASPCRMAFMARDPAAAGQPGRSSADGPPDRCPLTGRSQPGASFRRATVPDGRSGAGDSSGPAA